MSLFPNEGSPGLGLPSSPRWVEKSPVVSHGPLIMGVVNVTPDSFFDGGAHHTHDLAIQHALMLLDEGADILDVGGESTRPGAEPVSEAEELDRVLPVIEAIRSRSEIFISVDTSRSRVMREALALGANLINDVRAFRREPDAFDVAVSKRAPVCIMHMQGEPGTMQHAPEYDDVVEEVSEFLFQHASRFIDVGYKPEQVWVDPGIGFGKALEHNIKLLRDLNKFSLVERPMLIGASRKSFIEKQLGAPIDERLPASLACAAWAAIQGSQIIRVHDVAETIQAVRMAEALAR